MVAAVPPNRLPPAAMIQPTQMPASSEGTAWRLPTAKPTASTGGTIESQPNG